MSGTIETIGKRRAQAEEPDDITLIEEAMGGTFECERFHCRIFPEICVKRQRSWNPEVYEGCIGCKQGLEKAKKFKLKDRRMLTEPVGSRLNPYLDNEGYEPFAFLTLSSSGGK